MKRAIAFLLMLLVLLMALPVVAQDTGTAMTFTGEIEAISDTTITVAGLTVDISNLDTTIIASLESGMIVTINGNFNGAVVIAIIVDVDGDDNDDDPEATPEATETPEVPSDVGIELFISVDGGITWVSSDSEIIVEEGADVQVRFVVTNNGTAPLTAIDLSGTSFDTSGCEIPESLEPGASFDCTTTLEPEDDDDGLELEVVVTGTMDGVPVEASEEAEVTTGDDDDDDDGGVIIIIEGPVSEIEGNIIIIFNFEIELEDDDPRLLVIAIGDILHIEGEWGDGIIIAIIFIFVNVDVVIFEGIVWRDPGNCAGGPPPWAPAHGWRRRCQGGGSGGSHRGGSSGKSGRGSS